MPQPPNMQKMLMKMQRDMEAAQQEIRDAVVEASAGGGMVAVKVTGDGQLKDITISAEAIDPDDPELLQDMVLAAVNEGLRKASEFAGQRMERVTGGLGGALGGMGLPGL
jgi:nucleoid-associated protein EbfC